jgi:4-alpha-glucanotransferase
MTASIKRQAGVLLHISSLPQGDFGADAFHFVDILQQMHASVWQTLPLNATHADGSPYQCLSAHAGNPQFICLQKLISAGLISELDVQNQAQDKIACINLACERFFESRQAQDMAEYLAFCTEHANWLDDFASFMVLREQFQRSSWHTWPDAYRLREPSQMQQFNSLHESALNCIKFSQFIFFKQWAELRSYANSKQVALFGDIPIFVSYDSADVWANPQQFKLDQDHNMTVVAGVPPDYFSATGQRWGNPHYQWDLMQADGFAWWLARMQTQSALFDMVRIDHFRGLQAAWEIPASEETAMQGTWVEAPGDALLAAITNNIPDIILIAEDLGIITDEVNALRLKYQLPGMKILQFAFDGSPSNPYLPERIEENSVVYTGTHDNDTSLGWYQTLAENQRLIVNQYFNSEAPDMPNALIELALSTKAKLAIIPMQDILGLDSQHRMNVPGTVEGNWQWRFAWAQLQQASITDFVGWVEKYQRHST